MTDSSPAASGPISPGPAGPDAGAASTATGRTGMIGATVVQLDGTVVLRDFTLLAEPGELLTILGPSGSGKSTILRAIAGLLPARPGRVVIQGRDVTRLEPPDRDVAMVFEKTALYPTLDLARNMGFGLTQRHTAATEVQRRVEQQSRRLGIWGLLRRKPTEISMGQRGQAGIGRALVREPKVFLLDEPLANLDLPERARMRRLIADTVKSAGVSTFYVTHDQTEALSIGDRIAVIDEGQVQQIGTTRELYERPANLFVADFVGQAPLGVLTARLVASGGVTGYRVANRTLVTWQPVPDALRDRVGGDVTLGLRPESVTAVPPDPDPDATVLLGAVRGVERTGREVFVTVGLADGSRLVARFGGRTATRVGDPVAVSVDVTAAHVFDPRTGLALHHPA